MERIAAESGRVLNVVRLKAGLSTTQPLRGDELRAIGAWLKERARMEPPGRTFFVSSQRKPLHRATVNVALRKYSAPADLPLLAHSHMLRHACGFALADQGADTRLIQDCLGHRNIQHTSEPDRRMRRRPEMGVCPELHRLWRWPFSSRT